MDEEIDDEKKGLDTRLTPMRLQRETGTPGYAYGQVHQLRQEAAHQLGRQTSVRSTPPFFREKIQDIVVKEGENAVFSCFAIGEPEPSYTWFRNDGLLIESSRILLKPMPSGRFELHLNPVRAYDAGCYKVVARNDCGAVFCRARLKLGFTPGMPDAPKVNQVSSSEAYVTWCPPRFSGNSPILSYLLEYKIDQEDKEWQQIPNITREFYVVTGLEQSVNYVFRIKAKNKFGWGEGSVESRPISTKSDGKLELPSHLKFYERLNDVEVKEEPMIPDLDYNREKNDLPLSSMVPQQMYDLQDEISRGRFSVILQAESRDDKIKMAVKLIQNSPDSGARNEYEMMKSLCHQRIVTLLAATSSDDLFSLGMEKLSGLNVITYLTQLGEYNEDMVVHIVQQILDGIEYLHFRGICIIELQPDNIVMINHRMSNVKLVDFGCARQVPKMGGKVSVNAITEYTGKGTSSRG